MSSLWGSQPLVAIFFRRWGCVFCRLWAKEVSKIAPQLRENGVRLVGVGVEDLGVQEFRDGKFFDGELFVDVEKKTYKFLSFKRFSMFSVLAALFTSESRAAIAKNGVVPAQDVPVFAGSPTRPTAATVPVLLGVGNGTNSTTQFGGRPLRPQFLQLIPGRKGTTANPGRALLAAVGAGVLPATVAMLVPLALGRRRRRSTSLGDYPSEDRLLVADATTMSTREQNAPARRVNRLQQKRF